MSNILTQIGQSVSIISDPVIRLTYIDSFVDSVSGETATRYFDKKFRCSYDGINYSDYLELTDLNLQSFNSFIRSQSPFRIEFLYTRAGTDTTGDLTFNSIYLNLTFAASNIPQAYTDSVFADFMVYGNTNIINWCLNVLDKLYKKGIIPNYIVRGENNNYNWEDKDYIDFWRHVSCYFSTIVQYARVFEDFIDDVLLLRTYLEQKGLYFNNDTDIQELIYIMQNLYDEFRKRGTSNITYEKSVGVFESNGEFIRLINKQEFDEFIFALLEPEVSSFCIGRSSPEYRGTKQSRSLIKGYEFTKDFTTLSNYPLKTVGGTALSKEANTIIDEMGETVSIYNLKAFFANVFNLVGGVDYDNDIDNRILIDPSISYEITFRFQVTDKNIPVSFGCRCFNLNGVEMDPLTCVFTTSFQTKYFFEKETFANSNTWYWMRGIIYRYTLTDVSTIDVNTTGNSGYNLRFLDSSIKYIVPLVVADTTGAIGVSYPCSFRVYDLKVRPLLTTQASCFLANKRLILSYLYNKGFYTKVQVEEITRKYLIPYDSSVQLEFLN